MTLRTFKSRIQGILAHEAGVYPRSLNAPPNASFTYSTSTDGTVDFTDQSTDPDNNISSYSWDFDDGATSTARNPTHQYSTSGDYAVSLTVTDSEGAMDSAVETISVTANTAPTADFTYSVQSGTNTIDFSNNSSDPNNNISSYSWDFGDGSSSTNQNPTHDYAQQGSYSVTLTVTDTEGASDSQTLTVTTDGVTWTDSFENYPGTNGSEFGANWNHHADGSANTSIENGGVDGSQCLELSSDNGHSNGGFTATMSNNMETRQWRRFQFYFTDPSNHGGVGFWGQASNGNIVFAVGTTNPNPVYNDGGSQQDIGGGVSGAYGNWGGFDTIDIDWENKTYSFTYHNDQGESTTVSGANFVNSNVSDIASFYIGSWGSNMNNQNFGKFDFFEAHEAP